MFCASVLGSDTRVVFSSTRSCFVHKLKALTVQQGRQKLLLLIILSVTVMCVLYHPIILSVTVMCVLYHPIILSVTVMCVLYHTIILSVTVMCVLYHTII